MRSGKRVTQSSRVTRVREDAFGDGGQFLYEPCTAPTSHFYALAANEDKSLIAATSNVHAEGIRLAILRVGEEE